MSTAFTTRHAGGGEYSVHCTSRFGREEAFAVCRKANAADALLALARKVAVMPATPEVSEVVALRTEARRLMVEVGCGS